MKTFSRLMAHIANGSLTKIRLTEVGKNNGGGGTHSYREGDVSVEDDHLFYVKVCPRVCVCAFACACMCDPEWVEVSPHKKKKFHFLRFEVLAAHLHVKINNCICIHVQLLFIAQFTGSHR